MEQSLNYNKALPREVVNFLNANAKLPKTWQFTAKERELLERSAAYRFALLESILRPDGTPPTIGKNNPYVPFDPWPENPKDFPISQALKAAFDGNTSQVGFASIYFPWSGYAALRNGWGKQNAYAFFQNSRPGIGHHRESALRLDVSAYGEELLINSGAQQYSNQGNFNAYFQATYSQNSISVDGYSQLTQSRENPVRYQGPIPSRWYTSDEIDYIEGIYDGPYGGWNFRTDGKATERDQIREKTPHLKDVIHTRQVVFFKQPRVWVVVDNIISETPRDFTQTWNFAPEFSPQGIELNAPKKVITAKKEKGASLTMWQATYPPVPLKYQTHHGVHQDNAIFGWVSKDRAPKAYDFAAAPDVHVDWTSEGNQTLVTVIVPSPDQTARAQTEITKKDQEASDEKTPPVPEAWLELELNSGTTITLDRPDKDQPNLIMTCRPAEASSWKVTLDPNLVKLTQLDAKGKTVHAITPSSPKGFYWKQEKSRWLPVYNQKQGPSAK